MARSGVYRRAFVSLDTTEDGKRPNQKGLAFMANIKSQKKRIITNEKRRMPVSYTHLDVYKRQQQHAVVLQHFYDRQQGLRIAELRLAQKRRATEAVGTSAFGLAQAFYDLSLIHI